MVSLTSRRSSPQAMYLLTTLLFTLLISSVSAIDRITRSGRYLLRPNGERFFIKGVAYQESVATTSDAATGGYPEPGSYIDPLAMPSACTRDVAQLTDLGVNVIRVYSVNASQNHDACMKTFSDANIHVILDLALPGNSSISRSAPVWDTALQTVYLQTVDAFAKYDNVLAFSVANELVTMPSLSGAATFLKAAVRDVKAYLKSKSLDHILITTSLIDGATGPDALRQRLAAYVACGDESISIDLYGHNTYSWQGESTLAESGWSNFVTDFGSDYPVPIYFAEFGYVPGSGSGRPESRTWTEVAALFSSPLSDFVSGGCAFTYFPKLASAEGKDYGLVDINGDTVTPRGGWTDLKDQFAKANPSTAVPSGSAPAYPQCQQPSETFLASPTLPPTPDPKYCSCLQSNAWPCQATSTSANSPEILGILLGQTCQYLDQSGGSCSDLVANGTTGTYGNVSFCAPHQRLSWAMSKYYELQNYTRSACDFAGNATLPRGIVTTATSVDIAEAAESCAVANKIGVKTPVVGQEGYNESTAQTNTNSTGSGSSGGSSGASSVGPAGAFFSVGVIALGLALLQ